MVPVMMELSGRGGYWSPDDETARLWLVKDHRMIELSGRNRQWSP